MFQLQPRPLHTPVIFCYSGFVLRQCCVAQASLELLVLLPLPPECWAGRCAPHTGLYGTEDESPGLCTK